MEWRPDSRQSRSCIDLRKGILVIDSKSMPIELASRSKRDDADNESGAARPNLDQKSPLVMAAA
jgi:hypothetical protein